MVLPYQLAAQPTQPLSPAAPTAFTNAAQTQLNTNIQGAQTPLTPMQSPTYQAPAANSTVLQPQNQMTLHDFVTEAQKLGTQSFQAQADILGQSNQSLADTMARNLYSQNVGSASGIGQQVQEQALKDRTAQLAPYAQQTASQVGQQELNFQNQQIQQQQQVRQDTFNKILSGQIDKSQMSQQDYAAMGITDPNAIKTIQQMDVANQMTAQGLDPNNSADQNTYRTQLQNNAINTTKQNIISAYAQANHGQIPTTDQLNILLLQAGYGTGMLTPEQQNALIEKYNSTEWTSQMQQAMDLYKTSHPGKIICTELHRQGLMSTKTFKADQDYGHTLDNITYRGYVRWAKHVVWLMKRSKRFTLFVNRLATPWAKQMEFVMTGKGKPNLKGKFMMKYGEKFCYLVGKVG